MSDHHDPQIPRALVREACYAHARFIASGHMAWLRDITLDGCRFIFPDPKNLDEGNSLEIEIIPVSDTGIPAFTLTAAIRWTKVENDFCLSGASFTDLTPDSIIQLSRLVEYFQQLAES